MRAGVYRETGTVVLGGNRVSRALFRLVYLWEGRVVVGDKPGNQGLSHMVSLVMEMALNLRRWAGQRPFLVVSACHKWDTLLFQVEVLFRMRCNA